MPHRSENTIHEYDLEKSSKNIGRITVEKFYEYYVAFIWVATDDKAVVDGVIECLAKSSGLDVIET